MPETDNIPTEYLERDYLANPLKPEEVSSDAKFPNDDPMTKDQLEDMAKTPVDEPDEEGPKIVPMEELVKNKKPTIVSTEELKKKRKITDPQGVSIQKEEGTKQDSTSVEYPFLSDLTLTKKHLESLKRDLDKEKAYLDQFAVNALTGTASLMGGYRPESPVPPSYETNYKDKEQAYDEISRKYFEAQSKEFYDSLPDDESRKMWDEIQANRELFEDYTDNTDDSIWNMQGDWLDRTMAKVARTVVEGVSFGQATLPEFDIEKKERLREINIKLADEFVQKETSRKEANVLAHQDFIWNKYVEIRDDESIDPATKQRDLEALEKEGKRLDEELIEIATTGDAVYSINHDVKMGHIENLAKNFSNVITRIPQQSVVLFKGMANALTIDEDNLTQEQKDSPFYIEVAVDDWAESMYKFTSKITEDAAFEVDPDKPFTGEVGNLGAVIAANGAFTTIGGGALGVLYMLGMTADEFYGDLRSQNETRELGMTDREMMNLSSIYAPIATGLFYAPALRGKWNNTFKKNLNTKFIDEVLKYKRIWNGVVPPSKQGRRILWNHLKDVNKHGLELSFAMGGGQLVGMGIKEVKNLDLKDDKKINIVPKDSSVLNETWKTVSAAYLIGAGTRGVTKIAQLSKGKLTHESGLTFEQVEAALKDGSYVAKIKKGLQSKMKSKNPLERLSEGEYKERLEMLNEDVKAVKSVKEDLPPELRKESVGLVLERNEIERMIEGKEGVAMEKERIKEINERLDDIGRFNEKKPISKSEVDPITEIDKATVFNDVMSKVDKKEKVNEKEINEAVDDAFEAMDRIENNDKITLEDKEAAYAIIEDQIYKLDNYDRKTRTETRKVTATEKVRGVRKSESKQTKTPQERVLSRKVTRITEKADNAKEVEGLQKEKSDLLDKKKGLDPNNKYDKKRIDKIDKQVSDLDKRIKFLSEYDKVSEPKGKTKKATKGAREEVTTLEEEGGEFFIQEFDKDGKRTTRQKLDVESMNDFELVETTKDENGNVTGAILENKRNPKEKFSIDDVEIAYDLAEQKTRAELGEITEKEIERAFSEIEYVEVPVEKEKSQPKTPEKPTVEQRKEEIKKNREQAREEKKLELLIENEKLNKEAKKAVSDWNAITPTSERKFVRGQRFLYALAWVKDSIFRKAFRNNIFENNANWANDILGIDPSKIKSNALLAKYNKALRTFIEDGVAKDSFKLNEVIGDQAGEAFYDLATKNKWDLKYKLGSEYGVDYVIHQWTGNLAHVTNQLLKGLPSEAKLEFWEKSGLTDVVLSQSRHSANIARFLKQKDAIGKKLDKAAGVKLFGNVNKIPTPEIFRKRARMQSDIFVMGKVLSPPKLGKMSVDGWFNMYKGMVETSMKRIIGELPKNTMNKSRRDNLTAQVDSFQEFLNWYVPALEKMRKDYTIEEINKPITKNHPIYKVMEGKFGKTKQWDILKDVQDLFKAQRDEAKNQMEITGKDYGMNDLYIPTSFREIKGDRLKDREISFYDELMKGENEALETEAKSLKETKVGLGEGLYLNGWDFIAEAFSRFDDVSKEVYMAGNLTKLDAFMRSDGMQRFFKDPARGNAFMNEIKKSVNYKNLKDQMNANIRTTTPGGKLLRQNVNRLRRGMYRLLLGLGQRPKQISTTLSSLILQPKELGTVLADMMPVTESGIRERDAMVEFFANNADVATRNTMNLIDTGFSGKESKLGRGLSKISIGDPDFQAASLQWLSSYKNRAIKDLKKGESFSWESQLKNPNKKALAQAYSETMMTQGASIPEFTADLIKSPHAVVQAIRTFYAPFTTFLGQNKASILSDFTQMATDKRAKLRVTSYITALMGFGATAWYWDEKVGTPIFNKMADKVGEKSGNKFIAKAMKTIRNNKKPTLTQKMAQVFSNDVLGAALVVPFDPLADAGTFAVNWAYYKVMNNLKYGGLFQNQEEFKRITGEQLPTYENSWDYLFPEVVHGTKIWEIEQILDDGFFTYKNPRTGSESIHTLSDQDRKVMDIIQLMNLAAIAIPDQTVRKEIKRLASSYKALNNSSYYRDRIDKGEFNEMDMNMLIHKTSNTAMSGNMPNVNELRSLVSLGETKGKEKEALDRLYWEIIKKIDAIRASGLDDAKTIERLQQRMENMIRLKDEEIDESTKTNKDKRTKVTPTPSF